MSVAHVDVDLLEAPVEETASSHDAWRSVAVLGGVAMVALAAVPSVFAVLLWMRPELFLSR